MLSDEDGRALLLLNICDLEGEDGSAIVGVVCDPWLLSVNEDSGVRMGRLGVTELICESS